MTTLSADNIIKHLRQIAIEFEKLQVQEALGKAEVEDEHAERLAKLNSQLIDLQTDFYKIKAKKEEKYRGLEILIDSLRVQFVLSKAEALEVIRDQWNKFSNSLNDLERHLKSD